MNPGDRADKPTAANPSRSALVGSVILAWMCGLGVAGGIAVYFDSLDAGLEWVTVLAAFSSPMLTIGCAVCWFAPARIAARPVTWSVAAVAGCWVLSIPLLGTAAVFSLTVSVPAAAVFLACDRVRKYRRSAVA